METSAVTHSQSHRTPTTALRYSTKPRKCLRALKKTFHLFASTWEQGKRFLAEAFAEAEKHPEDFLVAMPGFHATGLLHM